MKRYMEDRVIEVAHYIIETRCTIREAGKHFNVSKSTIHKDVSERLKHIAPQLLGDVMVVINYNLSQRHIRGGETTASKYKKSADI